MKWLFHFKIIKMNIKIYSICLQWIALSNFFSSIYSLDSIFSEFSSKLFFASQQLSSISRVFVPIYKYLNSAFNVNNKIIENITSMQNENQESNFEKILHYNQDNQILGFLLTTYLNENPELRNSIMREAGNVEENELLQRILQHFSFDERHGSDQSSNGMSVSNGNSFIKERILNLLHLNQRSNGEIFNNQNAR